MRKLVILLALILSAALSFAAEVRVDLRPSPNRSRMAANIESQELGVLRHVSLSAGATSVDKLAVGDVIDFVMFDGVERTVILKEKLDAPLGGASFIGTVKGYDGMMNAVVVQSREGLQVDLHDYEKGRVYTVSSSENSTIVREIDPNMAEVEPSDTRLPRRSIDAPSLKLASASEPFAIVDILVAFDKGASTWAKNYGGGLQNFAELAVAKMNTALANNGLNSIFRFRLVGTTEVEVSANDVYTALDAIDEGRSGWDKVLIKRNEVGADIVTTMIDTGSASGTTGVSWGCISPETHAEFAYNVCAIRAVAQSHVMTHEVGHTMGAGHATADYAPSDPGPQLYEDSSGYYFMAKGTAYRTIMAYARDNKGRKYHEAPLFSSPDVMWNGVPAGDSLHNNARTLASTYVEASKWRENKVPYDYQVVFSPTVERAFDDSVTVSLTTGQGDLPIRYTTDGSEPTLSSALYSKPFVFKQSTTIKAASVINGELAPVFSAYYFKRDPRWPNAIGISGDDLGASGMEWLVDDHIGVQRSAEGGLEIGGYGGSKEYVSTLIAKLPGPGRFRFTYSACVYSTRNAVTYSVNGVVQETVTDKWNWGWWSHKDTIDMVVMEPTTVTWCLEVNDPLRDYDYSGSGVRVNDISWVSYEPDKNHYAVWFEPNNNVDEMTAELHEQHEVFSLPACSFTPPEGKRFAGWLGANGKRYDARMLVFDLAKHGEIIALTAIWE